ncbi:MAG: diguanylate cyclase/phosphodiesterase (GGDEF & EAL domains) with PAS/PAC sensor(s) [uncultured Thermomicrobiales bacterium]|uniref:diguanylate cyclase n=1 Tax=uncultured Thermomicrobiales bacterium TaxID=1645740 RepID=A0A6J4UKT1_9BACT|nr:MAG: diguanylate cyclase/phosphodiesterase (GGDEF & EAL domains) with PAS/PAC sensor(s) [uncultured Thermomicrobiales bacterium]
MITIPDVARASEAARDAATGLGNSLALLTALNQQLPGINEGGPALALLQIALDRSPGSSGRFGPGDDEAFLVGYAALLEDFTARWASDEEGRPVGGAFRIGSDEFALLLPSAGRLGARRAAAALLAGGESARVALSIGIGIAEPSAANIGGVLLAADGALRTAVARGGGRAKLLVARPPDALGAQRVVEWLAERAIDTQQLLDKATQLALTDPLTGLPNQRALELFLVTELPRARRREYVLALLLIDGDSLREYNSRHGYSAGDEWVRALGATLARETRASDLAVRWRQGDEFIVALPETTREATTEIGERIRRAIPRATASLPAPATISVGIALFPEDGETREELLLRAEAANRLAKSLGKNRIAFASDVGRCG